MVSELVQWRFFPYRDGDVWDVVADLVGVGLAVLVYYRFRPSWE
jgi:VanZ family protein